MPTRKTAGAAPGAGSAVHDGHFHSVVAPAAAAAEDKPSSSNVNLVVILGESEGDDADARAAERLLGLQENEENVWGSSGAVWWSGSSRRAAVVEAAWRNWKRAVHVERITDALPTSAPHAPYAKSRVYRDRQGKDAPEAIYGLSGAGVTVGVADTGFAINHCDVAQNATLFDFDLNAPTSQPICNAMTDAANERVAFGTVAPGLPSLVRYMRYICSSVACPNLETDFDAGVGDHGTHCATTIMGVAPGAAMVMVDLDKVAASQSTLRLPPSIDRTLWGTLVECHNASVFSFSFATAGANQYGALDYMLDTFLANNPHVTAVVAAGNEGVSGVGQPGTAKNTLTVGAVFATEAFFDATCTPDGQIPSYQYWKNTYINLKCGANEPADPADPQCRPVAEFSAQGPTLDGRRKPDLCAPGSLVIAGHSTGGAPSAQPQCHPHVTQSAMQGTSMATPIVAGAVALVAEFVARASVIKSAGPSCGTPCSVSHGDHELMRSESVAAAAAAQLRTHGAGHSTLLRALVALATQPCTRIGYFQPVPQSLSKHRLRAYAGEEAAAMAASACGLGEIQLTLLKPLPGYAVLMRGESSARRFSPVALTSLAQLATMEDMWQGPEHSVCLQATTAAPTLEAVLSWNDPPSLPSSCRRSSCLEHDLSVAFYTRDESYGGALTDVSNNLERLKAKLSNVVVGEYVKVVVQAHRVSATAGQMYSLAVTGAVTEADSDMCPLCAPHETIPCAEHRGIGERSCINASEPCTFAVCFGVDEGMQPLTGIYGINCEQPHCFDVLHPATSCTILSCSAHPRPECASGYSTCVRVENEWVWSGCRGHSDDAMEEEEDSFPVVMTTVVATAVVAVFSTVVCLWH